MPLIELVLCPPRYLSSKIQNNIWMDEMAAKGQDIKIDNDKAMQQFLDFYELFTQNALVYLAPPKKGLQDQCYITNAAVILPHVKEKTAILSNFKAPGRPGEELVVKKVIEPLGYKTYTCPYNFEGEAELKWLRDNIYIGGYGMRSDTRAFHWIERNFGAKIIQVKETDPKLYHLDCSILPLNGENVMVSTDTLTPEEVKKIEKVANVIPVNKNDAYAGINNSVHLDYILFNGSSIDTMKKGTPDYDKELHKNNSLEKICAKLGFELIFVDISEMAKSGAALSCCVLHLTYNPVVLGALPRKL